MANQNNVRPQGAMDPRRWTSQVFSQMDKDPYKVSAQDLDIEVAKYENRHRLETDKLQASYAHLDVNKNREIQELKYELNIAKEKLKLLQESKFKSQERELSVDDSKIKSLYEQLIQAIKNLVRHLMKVSGVRVILQQPDFIAELNEVFDGTMNIQDFEFFLDNSAAGSRSDSVMIGLVLRAVIFNILRKALFNHSVFKGFGLQGENWGSLPKTYQNLVPKSGRSYFLNKSSIR